MLNWGRKNQLKILWQRKGSLDVLVHEPAMKIWANRIVDKVLFLFRFLTSAVLENYVIIPTTLDSSLFLGCISLKKRIALENVIGSDPLFFLNSFFFFLFSFFFSFSFDLVKFRE